MRSVDLRSRGPASVRPVDVDAFFGDELPALLAERGDLAVGAAREMGLATLGVEVDGRAWHLTFDGDSVRVGRGPGPAAAVVRLDATGLHDLVNDLRTPVGFLAGGDLDMPVGRLEQLLDWWVVLRAVLDGQRAHTAGAVSFTDLDGAPLDVARSFTLDDDVEVVAHQLAEVGFVHLAGVFTEAEMAAVAADMDSAAGRYSPGDGNSWWAGVADGPDRLVRMQRFHRESETTAALLADDRLARVGALTPDDHRLGKPGGDGNLVEALVKPIGVVSGISDVPWHKDCSLGGHSYRCCSLTVGISVTGADAASGQLRAVAGSHRALVWPAFVRRDLDLPPVDLPTRTGDVTVHLSCTLHMSQPPVERERRVLYTDLSLPVDEEAGVRTESAVARIRAAAPTTVSQVPAGGGR